MSLTSAPAARQPVPAWRVAVISLVGVLAAGIGLVAGSFLLSSRAGAIGAAAAYVPAGSVVYAEMRLQPSAAQDAALREFLGHFPSIEGIDLDEPLYDQLTEWIDEQMADADPTVSWADDVAPWFDGRVAFALTEVPPMIMAPDPMLLEPGLPPGMLFMFGVTDPEAARATVERVSSESLAGVTTTEHAGTTIWSPELNDGAVAVTDDQLLVAFDVETITDALDARAGGGPSFADADELARLAAELPADWLAFAVYDLEPMMDEMVGALEADTPELADLFDDVLEHGSMRGAMAVTAAGDRIALDAVTTPPTGPLAVENRDDGLADEVPADALFYADVVNMGDSLATGIASARASLAQIPELAGGLDQAESVLGVSLEEMVAWIGDGAIAIGRDGGEVYGGLVLVPLDVTEATRRLEQLVSFARLGTMDPGSGLSVSEEEVAGTTVTTIRWQDPNGFPDPMTGEVGALVAELAITDDRVLIGIGDLFVRRVLELEPGDALGAQAAYSDAIAELGGAPNAGVFYWDLAATREAVEEAIGPMLDAFGGRQQYETEIRPWLLPFDRVVAVTRLDGDLLVQRMALVVE